MTVEEGLSIYFHADIVAAGGEEAADDAGSVGVFAADDGFATHVVAHLAHHGIETEVADVDAVAYGGLVTSTGWGMPCTRRSRSLKSSRVP